MGSVGRLHCLTMTAAENPTPGDLALAPLVTCKLCLCEQSLDKMTTLQECRCIFCTACLKQYMQLAIREGCGSPITCPDMVCLNHGTLQEAEGKHEPCVWTMSDLSSKHIKAYHYRT